MTKKGNSKSNRNLRQKKNTVSSGGWWEDGVRPDTLFHQLGQSDPSPSCGKMLQLFFSAGSLFWQVECSVMGALANMRHPVNGTAGLSCDGSTKCQRAHGVHAHPVQ